MTHRPLLLALCGSLVLGTAACSSADSGDGSYGGGASCADAECNRDEDGDGAGQGGSTSDPGSLVGHDDADDVDGETGSSTSAGAGTGGSSGGGGDEPTPPGTLCPTCCVAEPVLGTDRFVVRVDDSNSFASPLLVDALLPTWTGELPLPVRTHEYLNVYAPDVPAANGEIVSEAGGVPMHAGGDDGLIAFQVAIRHQPLAPAVRRSVALVVDTSPSIGGSVDRLLGAIDLVVDQLEPEDALGVYSWSPDPLERAIRPIAPVGDTLDRDALREAVQRAIDVHDTGSQLGGALDAALIEARAAATTEGTVLLVSDGSAGVDDDTLERVRAAAIDPEVPVRVIGVGVGPARVYSDEVLDAITDASGGASLYYDGSPAAEALLDSRFREMIDVARRGVRLRLTLPASVRLVATTAGDVSDGVTTEVEGQNLAVTGTMTFHNVLRWTGDPVEDACEAVVWEVVDGADATLASGTVTLGDLFADAAPSLATVQGVAVVSAASALKGPTAARLARALDAMDVAAQQMGAGWSGSRLEALCTTLTVACERVGAACRACPTAPDAP